VGLNSQGRPVRASELISLTWPVATCLLFDDDVCLVLRCLLPTADTRLGHHSNLAYLTLEESTVLRSKNRTERINRVRVRRGDG